MAFDTGGSRGRVKSDINVTPLVDVVLVLLIIFIVVTPVLMKQIEIVVPEVSDEEVILDDPAPNQIVLEWKEDGRIFVSGVEVARPELAVRLRERLETRREKIVFVDFHDSVRYGDAVQVLDTARGAGAEKLAIKLKDESGDKPPAPTAP